MRGAILAGGEARRLGGAPKGLLEVGGRRILDRLVDTMREALGGLPLLVANSPEAVGWRPDLRVVADQRAGLGTLGGLYTAVIQAPAPVVCVAWDMPFIPSGLVSALAAGLEGEGAGAGAGAGGTNAGYDVCLPASGGRRGMEPLCAAYGPVSGPAMAAALDRSDLRAIAFHEDVRVKILSEAEIRRFGDPERIFFNVNTADDLVRANGMTQ